MFCGEKGIYSKQWVYTVSYYYVPFFYKSSILSNDSMTNRFTTQTKEVSLLFLLCCIYKIIVIYVWLFLIDDCIERVID